MTPQIPLPPDAQARLQMLAQLHAASSSPVPKPNLQVSRDKDPSSARS